MLHEIAPGVGVIERGWLSSNATLLVDDERTALVDSGYGSHSQLLQSLVQAQLGERPLDCLINTHLHSDHCGGNQALQARYPKLMTHIPPGHAHAVTQWDEDTLTFRPTGQTCPRFSFDHTLNPGQVLRMGAMDWQVHAAPGHDPHSVVLFAPERRLLISADALWENGFGVVFPELDGVDAFDEVGATLDLIESLQPAWVIPGHGRCFTDVALALTTARQKLAYFIANPQSHRRYALKVLVKFKLLEIQQWPLAQLLDWFQNTPYMQKMHAAHFAQLEASALIESLLHDLERSGAATRQGDLILNSN